MGNAFDYTNYIVTAKYVTTGHGHYPPDTIEQQQKLYRTCLRTNTVGLISDDKCIMTDRAFSMKVWHAVDKQ